MQPELSAGVEPRRTSASTPAWAVSLPLLAGVYVYLYFLFHATDLLLDGDTYSHVAIGRWILEHGSVPTQDYFSHTMHGAPWTAFEWLSQVVLALVHQSWGWTGLVAVTAFAFALTIVLLTRSLLRHLEPIYVVLFVALAIAMTSGHVLARPHMLAMPLMMLWVIELVHASEERRSPGFWMLPVMTLWANLHGSFTLGLAFTAVFAAEAVLAVRKHPDLRATVRAWAIFLGLAVIASLLTPHGFRAWEVTWQVMFQDQYALGRIGEWLSPNFHTPQPLEVWLLGAFALALYQGLRIPPLRLVLFLGLVHLALKHVRYVELVGLLAPLFLASPLAAQWRERQLAKPQSQFQLADRLFDKLAKPAGSASVKAGFALALAVTLWFAQARPPTPPESIAPLAAIEAARAAGLKGRVLNGYEWGGYLIHLGTPVFIDGRSDMYRDAFIKDYVSALELHTSGGLEKLIEKYDVSWTLLPAKVSAVALLDRLPGWRRVYEDKAAVVHARVSGGESAASKGNPP